MKSVRRPRATDPGPARELVELRLRLAEAEQTLRAIGSGEVDAVVVAGGQGQQVFTLQGAEHAYRMLIESMNEGALTLTSGAVILYANQSFAQMVKCPLEQVTGRSFRRFLSAEDQTRLRPLLKPTAKAGAKIQVLLHAGDGSQIPVQISLRPLAKNAADNAIIGLVVTDITQVRRSEELLRALAHRVVQVQEEERARIAVELHDRVTQLLCAGLFRSRALAGDLPARGGPAKREAMKLCELLGQAAGEVERISHNLRPSVLEQLGLVEVLRVTCSEFAHRTGLAVKLSCDQLPPRLSADIELALYRILQEALGNAEQHARARHVTVRLRQAAAFIQLAINDDGIGFDPDHHPPRHKGKGGLGLLGMRERAVYVGGAFKVESSRRAGTKIEVRIPLPLGRAGNGHAPPIARSHAASSARHRARGE